MPPDHLEAPYAYPTPNSHLFTSLSLLAHPEGGFYAETTRLPETVPSPFAEGQERSLATQIYYLLSPASPRGRMHMNRSTTFHLHHQGRSLYTLVRPPSPSDPDAKLLEIKRVVVGEDTTRGEVRQLVVEGGWWKASEMPEEDLNGDTERRGALISEVVVPGFHWEDHAFLSKQGLLELVGGSEASDEFKLLEKYIRPIEKKD